MPKNLRFFIAAIETMKYCRLVVRPNKLTRSFSEGTNRAMNLGNKLRIFLHLNQMVSRTLKIYYEGCSSDETLN